MLQCRLILVKVLESMSMSWRYNIVRGADIDEASRVGLGVVGIIRELPIIAHGVRRSRVHSTAL